MEPLQVGDPEVVGGYRLIGRLGAGGMGRVYLGVTRDGGQAAVKVIRDDLAADTRFRHRFRREVMAASAVNGMFTARVLDADAEGDPPWLATQYVEGLSLRDAVLRYGPMPEDRLLETAQGIAEALAAIHAAGLTHRDLKPANVILSPAGPKVIDFGIARSGDATQLTGTGQIIGTLDYMAPEQIEGTGEAGPPVDVFALGCTLVYAATGHGPFTAEHTAATIYKVLHAEPDLRGIPPRVAGIVAGCLQKEPARRPTAVQLAVALRAPGTKLLPVAGPVAASGSARRRIGLVAAGVAALVVAATVVIVVLTSTSGGSPTPVAPTTTPAAAIDPNGPEARYVDRVCSSGKLLVALGDSGTGFTPTGDPAVAKRDFLTVSDRTIGTVDAALADFTALRDDAPNDQVRTQFGLIVKEFTTARSAYADARAQVAASQPLTVEVFTKAVDRYTAGTRSLALAGQLVKGITLPPAYTAASAVAPKCKGT